jgi:FixJ family two-component response regulator
MSDGPGLIAVVDDDVRVLKALRRLIETAGFDVTTYSTGAGFISDIALHPPNCVVLDLHMPDMNGFAVQDVLAGRDTTLPVIAITGQDSPEACERALRRGATAYLCKLVDAEALIGAIREALYSGKGQ